MRRFTTGLIAGSVIGMVGLTYAMSDKKTRRRMMKDGRRAMHKTNGLIDNITEMF
jgi:hypothetical protein